MRERSLLCGHQPDTLFAFYNGKPITAGNFLAHAQALADTMPSSSQIINLCEDRYNFSLGLVAALLRGITTLLPPNRAPDTIQGLLRGDPRNYLLTDKPEQYEHSNCLDATLALPTERVPTIPVIDEELLAVILYTSGSSGDAIPHPKTWNMLSAGAQLTAERLAIRSGTYLLATVPPQHMFGLETSIMLPLQCGCILVSENPLFPADIATTLGALPQPRALITTPLQLRACIELRQSLPPCEFILSATAPLSAELALQVTRLCDTTVKEIYGSTETGAIATRNTTTEADWLPLPGHRLERRDDEWWHSAPYLPVAQCLADQLQMQGERFVLLGRSGDLIKVAGKRVSMGELNHVLLSIDEVEDGIFFLPDEREEEVTTRLSAVVVCPLLSEAELITRLRQRIDSAFLPRPLIMVKQLPRNEVGKLPRKALLSLVVESAMDKKT